MMNKMTHKKILCFGETLLRLSPALPMEWIKTSSMPVYIGGAELNVAQALALWHHDVRYVTALPRQFVADEIIASFSAKGIDTSRIERCGDRIGLYYLPQQSELKSSEVVYDRAQSSFAMLAPGSIDWEAALDGCDWLHLSAISPALQRNVFDLCLEAVTVASEKGIPISIDLNFRSRLWQYGVSPVSLMPELVAYCDVVMGNLWAAAQLLGIPSTIENSEGKSTEELIRAAEESMQALQSAFPKAKYIAYTFRMTQQYFAVLYHNAMVVSPIFALDKVVDKVGSGDCFMAGLIHGIRQQHSDSNIISFATVAAVNKMGESGDATRSDLSEIMKRLEHVK
jgi:2-dehydro-3-deoxygluconokinase